MAQVTWDTPAAAVTLLTTELNALASGSATPYGPEINNVGGPQTGSLSLHIGSSSLAFTAASYCDVFAVPSTTPGTASGTYPTFTSGASYKLANSNYYVGSIFVDPATQSANVDDQTLPNVTIPSGYSKWILVNNLGVTMPATLNTLKFTGTPTKIV